MNIKEIDHRLYMPKYGVPTLQLGCGGFKIMSVINKNDGMTGIAFATNDDFIIGKDYPADSKKLVDEVQAVFEILSTSKESLIVLKEKIEEAIELFDEAKGITRRR